MRQMQFKTHMLFLTRFLTGANMKKIIIATITVLLFLLSPKVYAQTYRTDSNTVTTHVGNAPVTGGGIAACPIPGGSINCGSKNVPIKDPSGQLCGHCGVGYEAYMSNCTYPGIYFAMDIGGKDLQNVILPSVGGATIEWTWYDQTNNNGNQAIQRFSGTDRATGDKYWIQFHHSDPGSGNRGTHSSGDVGARICGNGCGMGHVHVEFAKVDPNGNNVWVDAPSYFCR